MLRFTNALLLSPRQASGDDGVVTAPALPGAVSPSVGGGGDAMPDAVVVASGEVPVLSDTGGATGSAPEGSTAQDVIPVLPPDVVTESPGGPGSGGAAPDASVSTSPGAVAAGLDATTGDAVAKAPAPGVGSVPEVSDDSGVPRVGGMSGAGEGVELPGGTAAVSVDVTGENATEQSASPVGEKCSTCERLFMDFDFLFGPRDREHE